MGLRLVGKMAKNNDVALYSHRVERQATNRVTSAEIVKMLDVAIVSVRWFWLSLDSNISTPFNTINAERYYFEVFWR